MAGASPTPPSEQSPARRTARRLRRQHLRRTPAIPVKLGAETIVTRRDAVDGLATRTLVRLRFFDDPAAPQITLMLYVPNATRGPVPVLLGSTTTVSPPSNPIRAPAHRPVDAADGGHGHRKEPRDGGDPRHPRFRCRSRRAASRLRGGDVLLWRPSARPPDGWRDGLRGYLPGRRPCGLRPGRVGAIGVWAWGLSRALDYLQTLPGADGRRVAVRPFPPRQDRALGRRPGRTVCRRDPNNSGEGGASLGRRNFGEMIAIPYA